MRELLMAFVIALIIGSIINGMQQKPAQPGQPTSQSGQTRRSGQSAQTGQVSQANQTNQSTAAPDSSTSTSYNASTGERRDYPDFASFTSVDSTNFDNLVLKSEKPVLIDCYVPNNLACDRMLPLVAAVSKAHEDSVIMAKLNVMDNLVIAHRYGVGTVPTFLLFNKGNLVNKLNGVMPQDRLESMLVTINQSASSQQSTASSSIQ